MSVNQALAQVSGDFLIAALVIYSLAVLAFAGDFAFGRPSRAAGAARDTAEAAARVAELTAVGVAGTAGATSAAGGAETADGGAAVAGGPDGAVPPAGADAAAGLPARRQSAFRAIWEAGPWVRAAVTLSAIGILAHLVAVVTRGYAVHRAPWGNMYEFVTALTCVAAIFFGYVVVRYRAWALGVFVMGAVVVALGQAETVIYTAAGPLVPALQSYWLSIHVTAMTLATGIFFVRRARHRTATGCSRGSRRRLSWTSSPTGRWSSGSRSGRSASSPGRSGRTRHGAATGAGTRWRPGRSSPGCCTRPTCTPAPRPGGGAAAPTTSSCSAS